MKTSSEYRDAGSKALTGKWSDYIILTLIYCIIISIVSACGNFFPNNGVLLAISSFSGILLLPMQWSYEVTFLCRNRNNEKPKVQDLFEGYKDCIRVGGTYLLLAVYVLLWAILLIIPGIMKYYSYSMTSYVLRDNPDLSFDSAIERSMAMMKGKKMKLFLLDLSFIGWFVICLFTLGLGFLILGPYMYMTHSQFYEDLKAEYEGKSEYNGQQQSAIAIDDINSFAATE